MDLQEIWSIVNWLDDIIGLIRSVWAPWGFFIHPGADFPPIRAGGICACVGPLGQFWVMCW